MTQIAGARVLITGGASGMGRRIALECARRRADVVLWDLDGERLRATAAEIESRGGAVRTDVLSVSDRARVYAAARAVEAERGPVDVLFHCAGVVSGKTFLETPDEAIERTFAVNALAPFWTCKAFLPGMIARNRGHVVTIASVSGLIGVAKLADYAASKWATIGFDESLRAELRRTAPGVRTTIVCPYFVNTGMFSGAKSRFPWLLPILDEGHVARRIVETVERGHRRLYMPWIVYTLPLLRLLPVPASDAIAEILGVNQSMDAFVGRTPPAAAVEAAPAAPAQASQRAGARAGVHGSDAGER
jgi:all-trans-retinol dehydrogenase (NAD+)